MSCRVFVVFLRLQSRQDVSAAIAVVGFEQISGSTLPPYRWRWSPCSQVLFLTIVPTCNTVLSSPSNPPMDRQSCRSELSCRCRFFFSGRNFPGDVGYEDGEVCEDGDADDDGMSGWVGVCCLSADGCLRSEEHTAELQSLLGI